MSSDENRIPYSDGLNRTFDEGDGVYMVPIGESGVITEIEVQPGIETQEFDIDDGETLNDVEISGLYQKDNVLAQLRFLDDPTDDSTQIPADVEITVAQGGQQRPRHNAKNEQGKYTERTAGYGEGAPMTELWQWGDTDLFFNLTNDSGATETFTIEYVGWQYYVDTSSSFTREEAAGTATVERID